MFFVMGWAVHYFPHYLMSRQLVGASLLTRRTFFLLLLTFGLI